MISHNLMNQKKLKKMSIKNFIAYSGIALSAVVYSGCKTPELVQITENTGTPSSFNGSKDSTNSARLNWRTYFSDPDLAALIDSALKNNQELNITMQEIRIARYEVRARKGEYLPFVGAQADAGVEKSGRYTRNGTTEANLQLKPGVDTPDPLGDFGLGAVASWEVDIWNKLHDRKNAAVSRYLGSIEGKNFMVTRLIAEIATSYYELLALDNQLRILKNNIDIQNNAFDIVKLQKVAARVTELAVKRFEAQVLHTKAMQFDVQQRIVETENRINFLVGRFPQPVKRNAEGFMELVPNAVKSGIPSQLLSNRPDIKQAELELYATKLDVKAARANFYPSLDLRAGLGYQAFNTKFLFSTPESMMYSVAGGLVAPLVNRNAIKATYYSANAKQIQAVYNYERSILNAYVEVVNQLSNINNLQQKYELKSQQVEALAQSVEFANSLFRNARADYMEVLLTQRDALESKFELIETKEQQLVAMVNVYRALGGGW